MILDSKTGGFNKNMMGGGSIFKGIEQIKAFNAELANSNSKYRAYLNTMKEAEPWAQKVVKLNKLQAVGFKDGTKHIVSYTASLVGATIKTVALQAASMALNAALTWGVSLAIQAIVTLIQKAWELVPTIKNLQKQFDKVAEEFDSLISEEQSLNDELTTTQERIDEIKSKGKLSFTDASELKRLEQQNSLLKRSLELNQQNKKLAFDSYKNAFTNLVRGQTGKTYSSLYSWQTAIDPMTEQEYTTGDAKVISTTEYLKELVQAYKDAGEHQDEFISNTTGVHWSQEDINNKISEFGDTVTKYQDYLQKLNEQGYQYGTNDVLDKTIDDANHLIDTFMALNGSTTTLFADILGRDKFAKANEGIKDLSDISSQSLQKLYADTKGVQGGFYDFVNYILSLNTIDWKTVLGEDAFNNLDVDKNGVISELELFDETTGECKLSTEQWAKVMPLLSNELNKVEDAAEEAESSFKSIAKTLSDGLDKLSDKKDILSEVKEQLDSFGAISADNISKILEQFPDNDDVQKAVAYYLSGLGTAQQVYDAMAKGYQNGLRLQAEELNTQLQNDENYYKSLAKLHGDFLNFKVGNYTIDISNEKNLATAKLKIENNLIETLKTNWSSLYQIQGKNLAQLEKYAREQVAKAPGSIERKLAQEFLSDVLQQKKIYDNAINEFNNLSLKGFNTTGLNASLSTKFDTDSGKTEAEKYFEKLKYQLDTNQITQEQYLKDLDWGYKQFYNKTADYLEDYAKYSQEVYDGFKDMYKEDLEAQKDAWEEKKDAVSEYYDKLREEIENTHDEEDYEKEQSEKRKEIFDLDMQIAELMRDGSEKAKARIAELEEERLKAEEELRDFETDKARENELSRLEKEQKAEEDKIQQQIDGIQGQLDKLDEDTISVRNAIISYARAKGVILDFAYASGTRSSVGGFGRINEKGIEMISAPDGNGNYVNLMPNSYVFSAKATEFLWKLATEHSLPQAMYNSIAKSIKTQSSTPSVNIAQPITITMGDIIIKGNADKQTVADIKKEQENTVRMVLQKIKELQK